jgi:hypothetical protein
MSIRLLKKTGRIAAPGLNQAVGTDGAGGNEENKQQGQPASGESVYSGSSGGVSPVAPQTTPQTKGSGFTNIQKILKASGTESGAGRLAQKAAGGVRQAATGAQAALAGATSEFQEGKKRTEGELSTRASQINPILTRATTTASTPNQAQQQQDVESWRSVVGGSYSGPTELGMSAEQQRKAAQSAALSKLAGDTSGRSALLQKYVGSPQYGESKQRLDALLLGRGGAGQIRSALREGSRAEQDIKRQQIVAQEQAKQLQQRASGIAEEAKSALADKERGVLKQVGETKEAFVGGLGAARTRVINALNAGGQISKSDLDLLGIKPEDLPVTSAPSSRGGIQSNRLLAVGDDGAQSAPGFASSAINTNKVFLGDLTPQELRMVGLAPGNWTDYSANFINQAGVTQDEFNTFKSIKTDADLRRFIQNSSPQLVAKYMFSGISPQQVSYDFTQFAPTEESLNTYYNTLGTTQFATPEEAAQLSALGRLSGAEYGDLGAAYSRTSTTPAFDDVAYKTYVEQQNRAFIENDPIYMEAKQTYDSWSDKQKAEYSWAKQLMDKREQQLTSYLLNNPLGVTVV